MAILDVNDVLDDPDFLDNIILIRRKYPVPNVVDELGRTVFIQEPCCVQAVVINNKGEYLVREGGGAYHVNKITIWYAGELIINRSPYYSDIVVWKGKRYVLENIEVDALNWGEGWMKGEAVEENLSG